MAKKSPAETREERERRKLEEKRKTDDARALAHPLRVRILKVIEREQEASPTQIAEDMGEPLGNVSYHVKALVEFGALKLTRTVPRRGAVEHFYSPTGTVTAESVTLSRAKAKKAAEAINTSLLEVEGDENEDGVDPFGRSAEEREELAEIMRELLAA